MSLSVRVKNVQPQNDMQLSVTFENGVVKRYDVKPLLEKFPHYNKLKDEAFFNKVAVDCGGCCVSWNSDIDISEVELWEGGVLELKSAFSTEEIEENFKDFDFFEKLNESLKQAAAYTKGEITDGVVVHKISSK